MQSNSIKDRIINSAVARLRERIITVEEIELVFEQLIDYLIEEQRMNITGLGFELTKTGCEIEIKYGN